MDPYIFFIFQVFGHVPKFTILREHPDIFSTSCVWQFMCKSNSIRIFVRAIQTGILRSCQLYETCGTTWLTWVSSLHFFENTIFFILIFFSSQYAHFNVFYSVSISICLDFQISVIVIFIQYLITCRNVFEQIF